MKIVLLGSVAGAALISSGLAGAWADGSRNLAATCADPTLTVAMGERGEPALREAQRGKQKFLEERRSAAKSVSLSPDQRTKLHNMMTSGTLQRIVKTNFPVSVGSSIPDGMRVYSIPRSVADLVPQYRSFNYIVVGQNLLIIDPDTNKIIAAPAI